MTLSLKCLLLFFILFLFYLFLDQLQQVIRAAEPASCSDALIYCVGALKLLSGSSAIMKELVQKDCIETLTLLLETINTAVNINLLVKSTVKERSQYLLTAFIYIFTWISFLVRKSK